MAQPQNVDQLQREKQRLEKEIEFTKNKIKELQGKRSLSLAELETLQKQIRVRQDLISNITKQIKMLDSDIAETQQIIDALEKDLQKLKEEYARMIYHAYVNQNEYNNLLFVFSAQTFNEAYKRMKYLQEYSDFRRQQSDLIKKTQESLRSEVGALEDQKQAKQDLLLAEQNHSNELNEERLDISNKVKSFKSQESRYIAEIRKKEKETAKINDQIERMIREAREKAEREARARAEAEARAKREAEARSGAAPVAPEEKPAALPALTPEAKALSNSFASNQRKLPWPVERGTIIRGFGKKPHPVLPGVETNNNGIDISTSENAEVRALFDGEVTNVFYSPVFQNGIMIMHGEYFTVYLYLKEVNVKQGDKVSTKQKIGTVYTNNTTGISELHIEIWKGTTLLNPALWLYN